MPKSIAHPKKRAARPKRGSSKKHRELVTVAYHEASHAVIAYLVGTMPKTVTIVPDKSANSLGCCRLSNFERLQLDEDKLDVETQDHLALLGIDAHTFVQLNMEKQMQITLAGAMGQLMYAPESMRECGDGHDREVMNELTSRAPYPEAVPAWMKWLRVCTEEQLKRNWPLVEAVAKELLEKRTINGEQLQEFINRYYQDAKKRFRAHNLHPRSAGAA